MSDEAGGKDRSRAPTITCSNHARHGGGRHAGDDGASGISSAGRGRSWAGVVVARGRGRRPSLSVRTKKSRSGQPWRGLPRAPGRNESHAEGPATACLRALMAWQTTPRRVHAFSAPTCLSLATV